MKSLLKGEIFKLKKNTIYLLVGFAVLLVMVASQGILPDQDSNITLSLFNLFELLIQNQIPFTIYIGILFFICFYIGTQFTSKRIHLEIMNGFTRKSVFFSKIVFLLPICVVVSWVLILVFFTVVSIFVNVDVHIIPAKKIISIILLMSFIMIRFYITMIFMNFIVGQGVISGIAIWLYNLVQMSPSLLKEYGFFDQDRIKDLDELFGWGQYMTIISETVTWSLATKVLITGFVEILLLGIISYVKFTREELR